MALYVHSSLLGDGTLVWEVKGRYGRCLGAVVLVGIGWLSCTELHHQMARRTFVVNSKLVSRSCDPGKSAKQQGIYTVRTNYCDTELRTRTPMQLFQQLATKMWKPKKHPPLEAWRHCSHLFPPPRRHKMSHSQVAGRGFLCVATNWKSSGDWPCLARTLQGHH